MTTVLLSMFADSILSELERLPSDLITVQDLHTFDLRELYRRTRFDVLICFGYPKMLPIADELFRGVRFVNAHTSLLPFGRGSNPNLCAWLNGEPHGVTIHEMAAAYDTGDILFQKQLILDPETETLRSSYLYKISTLIEFIAERWNDLVRGHYTPTRQATGVGSTLTRKDLLPYADLVERYNDRPITELLAAVRHRRAQLTADRI